MSSKHRLLQRKINRILKRKERRPSPIFSKVEYSSRYDWMLLNILFISPQKISANRIAQINNGKFPNVEKYIINRYSDTHSINENIYRMKNHIETIPTCPVCGNPTTYKGQGRYGVCCSTKCSNNYDVVIAKRRQTTLLHYGVEFPSSSDEIKEKIKETCIKKYGQTSFLTTKECRNTMKEKIGVDYPFQSKEILIKCKETLIDKYGVDNYAKTDECAKKIKETCIERYGVDSWSKTMEFRKMMHNNKDSINDKRFHTKERNGTLHTSYEEQNLYNELKKVYPDALTQYKSETYPFLCDFYIPSEDLYIEYQGYPSHGNKPYENTIEDNLILECWKEKKYEGWIYDWTKRDIMKRNCAKKNNLRWIEIFYYDVDELMNIVEKYLTNKKQGILSIYKDSKREDH